MAPGAWTQLSPEKPELGWGGNNPSPQLQPTPCLFSPLPATVSTFSESICRLWPLCSLAPLQGLLHHLVVHVGWQSDSHQAQGRPLPVLRGPHTAFDPSLLCLTPRPCCTTQGSWTLLIPYPGHVPPAAALVMASTAVPRGVGGQTRLASCWK